MESMIWNHSDKSELKMKNFEDEELIKYLNKIKTETLISIWCLSSRSRRFNLI